MACRRICTVCCRQQALYTCPRCLKLYCSTACYRNHSQTCSESFYREEATAQLKATKAGPVQTRHMLEVLQRLREQQERDGDLSDTTYDESSSAESDDGSDELTCYSTAHSTAQTTAPVHSTGRRLSPALRQLLQRAQQQGEDCFDILESDITADLVHELEELNCRGQLSHLIAPWSPWWESEAAAAVQLNPVGQQVVQEVHQQASEGAIVQQQLPHSNGVAAAKGSSNQCNVGSRNQQGVPRPCEQPLPTLQLLAGKAHKPSPLLPWQLLQMLVAYAAVLRRFNGEPDADGSWEAAQHLILLAPPLVQSALTTSQAKQQAQPQSQQQGQQQQQSPASNLQPPDSVRCACMQLLDAAAVACHATSQSPVTFEQWVIAAATAISSSASAAVAPETWTLLQVAETDALKLLHLGRSAVLLALSDARRMLMSARDSIRAQLQDSAGEGGQKQRHTSKQQLQQTKHILGLTVQKLWYLMVWSNEQAPAMYQFLAHELDRELQGQQVMSQASNGVSLTACTQTSRRPSPAWQPSIEVAKAPAVVSINSSVACAQGTIGSGLYGLD